MQLVDYHLMNHHWYDLELSLGLMHEIGMSANNSSWAAA